MINIQTSELSEAYLGTTSIERVYLGSSLIWEKGEPVLPYDAEVKWLRGTGSQYIDTGIIPNSSTGIYTYIECANNTDRYIFGLRNSNTNTRWCVGHSSNGFYYGYGSYQSFFTNKLGYIKLNWLNDGVASGSVGSLSGSVALPSLSFTPNYSIRLFGHAGYGSTIWNGKISFVKISSGSTIIMDLIPVRKDGVGYMYDKVSRRLLTNVGTFNIGPDVEPESYDAEVEYLEFNGNQYVCTYIISNPTFECSLDIMLTNSYGSTGILALKEAEAPQNATSSSANALSIWTNGTKIALTDKNYDSGWKTGKALNTRFTVSVSDRKLYLDGTQVVSSNSTTNYSYGAYYGLFRCRGNGLSWDSRIGCAGRFYGCKMWLDSELVRDYIPVRVGEAGYLYDKVSGKLFGNEGTGSFVLGPDVT